MPPCPCRKSRAQFSPPLQVIGAGFGRTGTMSLKAALEQVRCSKSGADGIDATDFRRYLCCFALDERPVQLGFGPCYHMTEMFKHKHASVWYEFATGESNDWERVRGAMLC